MHILVTGGLGFIGSNLVDYWMENDPNITISIYDSLTYAANLSYLKEAKKKYANRLTFIQGDIVDERILTKAVEKADVIYQLAAETHVGKSNYQADLFMRTNIIGVYTLFEVIRKVDKHKKIIFISSAEVYGSLNDMFSSLDEYSPYQPQSIYAVTKCTGEHLAFCMKFLYGLDIVIVRLFNNFGPRQNSEKVIPRFIERALEGLPLEIEGNGLATRDWLYVEDTCRALHKLAYMHFEQLEIINFAAQQEVSILDIAKMVLKYTRQPQDNIRYIAEREGNVHRHLASNKKMKKVLNVEITTPFEERIRDLVVWYNNNKDTIKIL